MLNLGTFEAPYLNLLFTLLTTGQKTMSCQDLLQDSSEGNVYAVRK